MWGETLATSGHVPRLDLPVQSEVVDLRIPTAGLAQQYFDALNSTSVPQTCGPTLVNEGTQEWLQALQTQSRFSLRDPFNPGNSHRAQPCLWYTASGPSSSLGCQLHPSWSIRNDPIQHLGCTRSSSSRKAG